MREKFSGLQGLCVKSSSKTFLSLLGSMKRLHMDAEDEMHSLRERNKQLVHENSKLRATIEHLNPNGPVRDGDPIEPFSWVNST